MSTFSMQKGYTFIELLVVFSIMGILGVLGIASFVSFNNSQVLEGAGSDVSSLYVLARQRALSQIKPEQCTAAQSLAGYTVLLNIPARTYQLNASCGSATVVISQKALPPQVTFAATSPVSTTFTPPNGSVNAAGVVTINGFGKTKTISITPAGTIAVQ